MTYILDDRDAGFDPGLPVGTVMNWAGALVSVTLMAGLAFWGWQLLVRDVTGVPVVRAIEGPMRIAPEEPGGEVAEYQGLSVTRVGSEGAEEAPAERVVLAPPPVQLADEDRPVAALIPDTPASAEVPVAEEQPRSAIEMAIAEALSQTDGAPAAAMTGATLTGGLARSPRPPVRPRLDRARMSAVSPAAPATNAVPEGDVDPATLSPGTRLVQLGAFATLDEARAAWSTLDDRLGDFMVGKSRLVQEASAGGSTFYRLRAVGFDDLSDARRFCAVLVAEQANCIPVVTR